MISLDIYLEFCRDGVKFKIFKIQNVEHNFIYKLTVLLIYYKTIIIYRYDLKQLFITYQNKNIYPNCFKKKLK